MKKIKVMKLKRIMISYFMVLLFIVVIPSRVAAAELDSGDIFLVQEAGQRRWYRGSEKETGRQLQKGEQANGSCW